MNRCPITYDECGNDRYSKRGLNYLSPKLNSLHDFPYTAKEQVDEAVSRIDKISIQGIQPKISVILNVKKQIFELADSGGEYIIKPQNILYDELPQNEDLTMKLAEAINIEIPFHGMVYSKDGSLSYFIKRFDRIARGEKVPVEDFAQLTGSSRQTKYDSTMEKIVLVIDKFCTFPAIEKVKLFRLTLFNFLIGNEDMHLKNYSLISRGSKVELSPAYDLINTTIAMDGAAEETALPIAGKKSNLGKADLYDYFAVARLKLNNKLIIRIEKEIIRSLPKWNDLIKISFLSDGLKDKYLGLISERAQRLAF